jgi:hypothetical protein
MLSYARAWLGSRRKLLLVVLVALVALAVVGVVTWLAASAGLIELPTLLAGWHWRGPLAVLDSWRWS